MTEDFYLKIRKPLLISCFVIVFFIAFVQSMPTWVLNKFINYYSKEHLQLFNQRGTFWQGSALLVAVDAKLKQSEPLVFLNWNVKLGLKRFVDINFFIGNNSIAEIYLTKTGLRLTGLNLSLSISQVSQLSNIVKDLGLSGNLNINADAISLAKVNSGIININISNVASSLSPVNPLGSYNVTFNLATNAITVASRADSSLLLQGAGNTAQLNLDARVNNDKKDQLNQFITIMGVPKADGAFNFKLW